MSERAELERLRKLKRLRELEEKERLHKEGARNNYVKTNDFVPTAENLAATQDIAPKPERSFLEQAKGVGEAALAMTTGAVAGAPAYALSAVNQLGNEIASGEIGTQESVNRVRQAAERGAQSVTYQPRGEAGQEHLQDAAEFLQPLEALAPLTPQISGAIRAGKGLTSAAKMKNIMSSLGIDDAAAEIKRMTASQAKRKIAERLSYGDIDIENIAYQLDEYDNVVKNPTTKTIASLYDSEIEGKKAAVTLQNLNKEEKVSARKMVDIMKDGIFKGGVNAIDNRPSDVIGAKIAGRIKKLNEIKKQAQKEMELALAQSESDPFNPNEYLNVIIQNLRQKGVAINLDDKGNYKIDSARATVVIPNKSDIEQVLNALSDADTFTKAHNVKKLMRKNIDYDQQLGVQPLDSEVVGLLKNVSGAIGKELNLKNKTYAGANEKYEQIAEPLSMAQKFLKNISIDDISSDKRLGRIGKRIATNFDSRDTVNQMIDLTDEALAAANQSPTENIKMLVSALADMEKALKYEKIQAPFGITGRFAEANNLLMQPPEAAAAGLMARSLDKMIAPSEIKDVKTRLNTLKGVLN